MNAKSKTETITHGPNEYDFSSLETSKDYTLDKAILDKYVNNIENVTLPHYAFINKSFFKNEENNSKMNENDILKAYIEKVDRDQSDLRTDIRESENRTSEKINKIEERMDVRLNRIEDMIRQSTEQNSNNLKSLEKEVHSKLGWVIATCLTTIIGIGAMVIAVYS